MHMNISEGGTKWACIFIVIKISPVLIIYIKIDVGINIMPGI